MKFILGKKLGMSQIFDKDGKKIIPVTVVKVEPCFVTQIKKTEKDGYDAVQLGSEESVKANKPMAGHLNAVGKFFKFLKEFRAEAGDIQVGNAIDVSTFASGDKVKVIGISKAKGFQGTMKRHNFKGGQATHGQKHSRRRVGSLGATYPEKVIKGRRMAGRMGGEQITQKGLEIAEIRKDENLMLVKGAVPGNIGSILKIISEQ